MAAIGSTQQHPWPPYTLGPQHQGRAVVQVLQRRDMGQSLVKEYLNILSKVEDSCVKKITASVETYRSFGSLVKITQIYHRSYHFNNCHYHRRYHRIDPWLNVV